MPDFVGVHERIFCEVWEQYILWGNVPALDLLLLEDNEESSTGPFHVESMRVSRSNIKICVVQTYKQSRM